MKEADTVELRKAIESQHGGTATLAQSVPVRETFEDQPVWEGIVHVFELEGHPIATRAYAWSSPIEGSDKRRFFAVLHIGPVKSPQDAMRAAIAAEHRRQSWRSKEQQIMDFLHEANLRPYSRIASRFRDAEASRPIHDHAA